MNKMQVAFLSPQVFIFKPLISPLISNKYILFYQLAFQDIYFLLLVLKTECTWEEKHGFLLGKFHLATLGTCNLIFR